eukprot:2881592-Prymnesium_polylepis.1
MAHEEVPKDCADPKHAPSTVPSSASAALSPFRSHGPAARPDPYLAGSRARRPDLRAPAARPQARRRQGTLRSLMIGDW